MAQKFSGRAPIQKVDNKNLIPALKKTFVYMKKYLPAIIVALLMAAVGAVLVIIGPDKIGDITDYMQAGLLGAIDMDGIRKTAVTLLIIYFSGALLTFGEHYIMSTVTLKVAMKMRTDLSEKINKVPLSYFNRTQQGDVLSRVTNDVSALQRGLSNALPSIISSVAQFVGCLVMMFVTEWRLALCAIGATVVGMLFMALITSRSQKYFVAQQDAIANLNGYIEEMYSGHEVVRISRAGKKVKSRFSTLNDAEYVAGWKSQFLSGIMQPLMTVVGNLGYVAVCVVGSALALDNVITFGVIISFIIYVRLFTSPLTQIAQAISNLQSTGAAAYRVFDFLDKDELEDESEKSDMLGDVKGYVSFKNVRFAYPDAPDKIIIKNFSAEVLPGQKVAIVGPTGAGKTTMVNLLMRFFEINGGSISIDGVPIDQMKREEVHSIFAMVLQDTWLFEGTVRENLVYNLQNVTDDMLENVCRACGIAHFVHSLPNGFDTVLSESISISAGQKQLLTIARAMLQNSPMLILDEATSSVDTRTEIVIQNAMDALTKDRTSFVIAHRLSTIKNADLILVLKDGDVVESGTHEALLAENGFYASLYNSQFERV